MKKRIAIVLSLLIVLALTGCGDEESKEKKSSGNHASSGNNSNNTYDTNSDSNTNSGSGEGTYQGTNKAPSYDSSYGTTDGHVYYETDFRNASSIQTDPSEWEYSDTGKASFLYANLCDVMYNGLGRTFRDVLDYTRINGLPTVAGLDSDGIENTYYTRFSNNKNCDLIFNYSGEGVFGDQDKCIAAKGWLCRVFDYDKTQGMCDAKALADVLNAKGTYVTTDYYGISFVPSNLRSNGLYVIEADIPTAQGILSGFVYVEADSDSYHIGEDTWVEVVLKR